MRKQIIRTYVKGLTAVMGFVLTMGTTVWAQPEGTQISQTLTLAQAIEKAVSQSPRLASAKAGVAAANASARQAMAFNNPEVGFDAENIAGNGIYQGSDAGEFTYTLSQKLEVGKRPERRNMVNASTETATLFMQSEKLDIIRDVKIAYAHVLAAQATADITTKQKKLAIDVLANVSKRVNAARDPLIYKSQAEVSLATAQLSHAQAERELAKARKQLALQWGDEALLTPLETSSLTNQTRPEALNVYQSQLASNPSLARFTSLKLAKQAEINLEKAQLIPDPSVNVGLRTFRETDERAMVVGVSMPIPVFNRNAGGVAKARAELNQLESDNATATLEAGLALTEAWNEWEQAAQEASLLTSDIIPAAEKAFTLAQEGYDRGRFAYLEILTAQRTLSEARGQYTQALLRQATARAQVERLIAAQ